MKSNNYFELCTALNEIQVFLNMGCILYNSSLRQVTEENFPKKSRIYKLIKFLYSPIQLKRTC